jgi:hypothetical protein
LTYLDELAEAVRAAGPRDSLPDDDTSALFLGYAVLVLAKGENLTGEDVHNAWVARMASKGESYEAMVPFAPLPREAQDEDSPFVMAIRRVARERGQG